MVGASLIGLTVSANEVEADAVPSLTVMVMVAVPLWLAPGSMVTVLFAPLPPKVMLATGTSDVLLDEAVSVSDATGVSESFIVNGIAPVAVFSVVV